jgi:Protein of unknown function (DUF3501)
MKKVDRSELLSFAAYEEIRPHFRARMIQVKARRRMSVGDHMSLIFENHDTMLLQVQEMMRTERISDEAAIAHELETYNELIPSPGNLSATLFLEYEEPKERTRMLAELATLRTAIHLVVGELDAQARFATHHGEEMDRLPAVNYLMFELGAGAAAVLRDGAREARFEIRHASYPLHLPLPRELREELAHDLD